MTPIEKNIIVVDENGNEYEATYLKRAKGLVKSGRARFISDNKICMQCPPTTQTEDSIMDENKKYTLDYCLEQIEKISEQTEYLNNTISELGKAVPVSPDDNRAQALTDTVKCRETTNQKLIAFYEKMYDDLKPKAPTGREFVAIQLLEILKDPYSSAENADRARLILERYVG